MIHQYGLVWWTGDGVSIRVSSASSTFAYDFILECICLLELKFLYNIYSTRNNSVLNVFNVFVLYILQASVQSMVQSGLFDFKPFVHSDCGGDYRGSGGQLIRWAQHCSFGTILRLHGDDHRPWTYDAHTEAVLQGYLKMRYQMVPMLIAAGQVWGIRFLGVILCGYELFYFQYLYFRRLFFRDFRWWLDVIFFGPNILKRPATINIYIWMTLWWPQSGIRVLTWPLVRYWKTRDIIYMLPDIT